MFSERNSGRSNPIYIKQNAQVKNETLKFWIKMKSKEICKKTENLAY